MPFQFFAPTHPLSKGRPMSATRRRRLLISYVPDWVLTILLAVAFYFLDKTDGYRREFSLSDTSLRHPYAVHERVPNKQLLAIALGGPLVLMPIVNFITVRSLWDLHNSTLGLILGLSLTGAITQTVKITVGRPRPDIISRCDPPPGLVDEPYKLSNWTICRQEENHILMDGFRSFPSGHSSLSFAGMGFLSFYLAGKMHLFDERGHTGKAWLSLMPFLAAALVAVSRSMDYRHHWHDILVGSILGVVCSYFAYRQYYPSLASPLSHRPYSPRIKDEDSHLLPVRQTQATPQGVRYDAYDHDYELGATVPRPAQASLEEVWKQDAGDYPPRRSNSYYGQPPVQPRDYNSQVDLPSSGPAVRSRDYVSPPQPGLSTASLSAKHIPPQSRRLTGDDDSSSSHSSPAVEHQTIKFSGIGHEQEQRKPAGLQQERPLGKKTRSETMATVHPANPTSSVDIGPTSPSLNVAGSSSVMREGSA